MGIDKPTPGEWSTSGQLIVSVPFAHPNPKAEPTAKTIASVCWDYNGDRGATESRIPWSEAAANMRLIAAAPELLEALRDCLTDSAATAAKSHKFAMQRLAYISDVAERAIRKATGE